MGVTTDFIGHVTISPPLNEAEQLYLRAFSESRRYRRKDGPYDVPGNPAAEYDEIVDDIDRYNSIGMGQPSLWCKWVPSWSGTVLSWDGHEKFYGATAWMQYLIDHFLALDAVASTSGLASFDGFTFDHVLNGLIAGCRRDTLELYVIEVRDNVVARRTLTYGSPRLDEDLLPYEAANDRYDARRNRRRLAAATKPRPRA